MSNPLPPAPINEPPGSFAWQQWYSALREIYAETGAIPWASVDKTGSNLNELVTRSHQVLQTLQGGTAGEYYHLTAAQSGGTGVPRGIRTETGATYTVGTTDHSIIANRAGTITLTLPTASSFTGRELLVRTITANTVVSNASNVVPLAGGAAGTAIVGATAGLWALLQSDGTNWQIMAGN